jgi:chromate transporter
MRWIAYALSGGVAAATIGPYLVLVLLACGVAEIVVRREASSPTPGLVLARLAGHAAPLGSFAALAWVAFKVGALSYGGGFVIVPLMQHDAVTTYHWMTGAQFLNAVALGQVTPGPVVQTVAVVGYAAHGVGGGLFAALIAFVPSFFFVLLGGPRFDQIRANVAVRSFLTGASAAVIGAIAGSAIPLGLAFQRWWQVPLLAGALLWLFVARRGVVSGLLIAGGVGAVLALSGVAV